MSAAKSTLQIIARFAVAVAVGSTAAVLAVSTLSNQLPTPRQVYLTTTVATLITAATALIVDDQVAWSNRVAHYSTL
jgi:hypothetical protein